MAFAHRVALGSEAHLEDPLAYLPCSDVTEYRKGQVIYNRAFPPTNLYLVIDGKVAISHATNDGRQIVVDIYQADDFFGEAIFGTSSAAPEEARALESCKVMSWTLAEVEAIASRQPRLGIALLQAMVTRNLGLTQRLESLCVENIRQRLARSLLRLAGRMGTKEQDGALRMIPLTHELLAQYVGTSREVVTMHMNRLRREGLLRYSRKSLILYQQALENWLSGDTSRRADPGPAVMNQGSMS